MTAKSSFSRILGIFDSCCAFDDFKHDCYEQELEEQHFRDRLATAVNVTVLLEDGGQLSCTLHVDLDKKLMRIACEDQVREMKFDAVKKILHTKDELSRVQTNDRCLNIQNSVALHLVENGNCIPFTFNTSQEKKFFLNILGPFIGT
ncbi:PH-like domain containing protein [Babesia gibsoni]|uniref:PH-like domain containing protein n=1 Tax=Babesia gibsoni TaxID=33632 RepID=A0AAD8PF70_BABGI|nr:PH-like domain containing protein [Babesia gibsoni]